jgi:NAD-dependent DNA ligase
VLEVRGEVYMSHADFLRAERAAGGGGRQDLRQSAQRRRRIARQLDAEITRARRCASSPMPGASCRARWPIRNPAALIERLAGLGLSRPTR